MVINEGFRRRCSEGRRATRRWGGGVYSLQIDLRKNGRRWKEKRTYMVSPREKIVERESAS